MTELIVRDSLFRSILGVFISTEDSVSFMTAGGSSAEKKDALENLFVDLTSNLQAIFLCDVLKFSSLDN